jgi:hypothetical protein
MIQEYQLRVLPQVAADSDNLRQYLSEEKGLALGAMKGVRILKRSIDARQRTIYVNLKVRVYINEQPTDDAFVPTEYPYVGDRPQVIVVGAGPGGLFAALRLIETCREQFSELAVIEADVSKADYIMIVRDDYTRAKIAWDGMDEPSDAMMPSLKDRLTRLSKAISSNVDGGIREWDARKKGDVYGNTMRDIL